MNEKLRIFSLVLLFLLGSSAIGGGWMFIHEPSGFSMELPIELLKQTPFDNYLIPGVILLVAFGFLSITVALLSVRMVTNYELLIIFQGCILLTWLTIELILNTEFYHPLYHIPLYTISLLLIAMGLRIRLSVQRDIDIGEGFI